MDRRSFLQQTAATAIVATTGLAACGKGDDDSGSTTTGSTSGTTTSGTTSGNATGTAGGTPGGTSSGTPSGTGGGTTTSACAASQAQAEDSEGHGHHLVIPLADWQAGAAGSYVTTASNHDHTVQINAQQMADLAANCTVTVNSNDTHPHTWIITIS